MKKILLSEYKSFMGELIDINYNKNIDVESSMHIPYERLMINYKDLLVKGKKYYIFCNGGIKSRKAVSILEYYGYDVTLVIK